MYAKGCKLSRIRQGPHCSQMGPNCLNRSLVTRVSRSFLQCDGEGATPAAISTADAPPALSLAACFHRGPVRARISPAFSRRTPLAGRRLQPRPIQLHEEALATFDSFPAQCGRRPAQAINPTREQLALRVGVVRAEPICRPVSQPSCAACERPTHKGHPAPPLLLFFSKRVKSSELYCVFSYIFFFFFNFSLPTFRPGAINSSLHYPYLPPPFYTNSILRGRSTPHNVILALLLKTTTIRLSTSFETG